MPVARAVEVDCWSPYDNPDTPCPVSDGDVVHGYIKDRGGVDYFQFSTQLSGTHAHITLDELPADYDLYLADASAQLIAQSVTPGLAPELIDTDLDTPGDYFLYVVSDPSVDNDPDHPYVLTVGLIPPFLPQPTLAPVSPTPTMPPAPAHAPTPAGVPVPSEIGRPLPFAIADLRGLGLKPELGPSNPQTGLVNSQNPPPGTPLAPGAPVSLGVASGPIPVPDVRGMSEADTVRLLSGLGFRTSTTRRPSTTVPSGAAIGTDPAAGAQRLAGTQIAIYLSSGGS
ncbi:MAG: PASTA domain-containing protein [Chloroflexi bacterium]|nr:PASTA domain-containing protein [Chloroflexota bacterium]